MQLMKKTEICIFNKNMKNFFHSDGNFRFIPMQWYRRSYKFPFKNV